MIMRFCLVVVALFAVSTHASGAIVSFIGTNSTGANARVGTQGTGIEAVNLNRGPGLSNQTGEPFTSQGYTASSNLATAVANEDYVFFGFKNSNAFTIQLSSVGFAYNRTNSGPQQIAVQYSKDNFATSDTLFTDSLANNSIKLAQITSLPTALQTIDSNTTVHFRIYGFAGSGGGNFVMPNHASLNDGTADRAVLIQGVIPEPASLSILAMGGVALPRRHRVRSV